VFKTAEVVQGRGRHDVMAQDLNVGCSSLEVEIPEKNENDWKEGK